MDLITVRELYKHPEEYLSKEMQIGGWVRSLRDSKSFSFIVVDDGSYFETLQIVYYDNLPNSAEVSKLNAGTAIIVKGILVVTFDAKRPFEIQATEVTMEGISASDYPLQKKRHSSEYLRSISHLRPGTSTFQAVFHVRSLITYAIHQYFQERNFACVHTPLITGGNYEGTGEMFQATTLDPNNIPKIDDGKVNLSQDFFNEPTSLTVSGQLNAETYAMVFHNVYIFGPTFRAKNPNTIRHTAEFWMIEPEMTFADLDDDMRPIEGIFKYIIKYVLRHAPEEMNSFNQFVDKGLLEHLNDMLDAEFGHITYTDAVEFLKEHNGEFNYKASWGYDLQTEHKHYLTEKVFKKPVFVTDYPKKIKAFYTKISPDNKTVAAVDCLVFGIGEITGGGRREDNLEELVTRTDELGLNKDDYGFYLDLRKYGSTHRAGSGLGSERYVMYLTGMGSIRDMIPFPRTANDCELQTSVLSESPDSGNTRN